MTPGYLKTSWDDHEDRVRLTGRALAGGRIWGASLGCGIKILEPQMNAVADVSYVTASDNSPFSEDCQDQFIPKWQPRGCLVDFLWQLRYVQW
jgi:hypothetical protein